MTTRHRFCFCWRRDKDFYPRRFVRSFGVIWRLDLSSGWLTREGRIFYGGEWNHGREVIGPGEVECFGGKIVSLKPWRFGIRGIHDGATTHESQSVTVLGELPKSTDQWLPAGERREGAGVGITATGMLISDGLRFVRSANLFNIVGGNFGNVPFLEQSKQVGGLGHCNWIQQIPHWCTEKLRQACKRGLFHHFGWIWFEF
jgi:hypothetical protein